MIQLQHLKIENFLSFRKVELTLNDRGLVFIVGKNYDSDCFDSNGSGKSSLFESIVYCLFGVTVRGIKADDVINNKVKENCKVSLSLTDNVGDLWEVTRYRKHKEFGNRLLLFKNNVEWNESVKIQDKIVSVLGMDLSLFTQTLMLYQETSPFSACSDLEQKKLLEKLYDLEKYAILTGLAKEEKERYLTRKIELEKEISFLEETFGRISEELVFFTKKNTDYIAEVETKIAKIKQEIKKVELKRETTKEEFGTATTKTSLLKEKIAELQTNKSSTDKTLQKLNESLSILRDKFYEKKSLCELDQKQVTDLKSRLIRFKEELKGTCPVCGQEISSRYLDMCVNEINATLKTILQSLSEKENEKNKVSIEVNSQTVKIANEEKNRREREEKLRDFHDDLGMLTKTVTGFEKDLAVYKNEIENLKTQITDIKTQENPYVLLLKNKQKEEIDIATTITNNKNDILKCNKRIEQYAFIEKMFSRSGIPSYLLDGIIPMLNKYANYYSSVLTGKSIQIDFSNQSVLKSGENREIFEVRVFNEFGSDTYFGDSGGEKRRVDLCVFLALQKVARLRSKNRFNVLFMDEVFDIVDDAGIEQVISLLEEEAKECPSIFIIGHNNELAGYFDNIISVKKTNGFSTVVEEELV